MHNFQRFIILLRTSLFFKYSCDNILSILGHTQVSKSSIKFGRSHLICIPVIILQTKHLPSLFLKSKLKLLSLEPLNYNSNIKFRRLTKMVRNSIFYVLQFVYLLYWDFKCGSNSIQPLKRPNTLCYNQTWLSGIWTVECAYGKR